MEGYAFVVDVEGTVVRDGECPPTARGRRGARDPYRHSRTGRSAFPDWTVEPAPDEVAAVYRLSPGEAATHQDAPVFFERDVGRVEAIRNEHLA